MNSINPPQDQFNSLFDGLDSQMRTLEKRQEARKKILDALQNGKLQDALSLAKNAELILLDDPAFSLEVVKYWIDAKNQFEDTQNKIELSKQAAESGLITLLSVSQHFQALNSLVSADHALRELELQNLQKHLSDLSQYFDTSDETQSFEKDWYQRMENDYKWLAEEEKEPEKWYILAEIKQVLQNNQFTDRLRGVTIDHPDSYLISLWKQQDFLSRFRQGNRDEYFLEITELEKIVDRVNKIKAELGDSPEKKQIDADRLWRLLDKLEEYLLDLPPEFFRDNNELSRRLSQTLDDLVGLMKKSEGLSPQWLHFRRDKKWENYKKQRKEFLDGLSSGKTVFLK